MQYATAYTGLSTISNRDTLILHVLVAIAFGRSFCVFLHIWGVIKEDHDVRNCEKSSNIDVFQTKFPATELFRLLGDYTVGASVAALCLSR